MSRFVLLLAVSTCLAGDLHAYVSSPTEIAEGYLRSIAERARVYHAKTGIAPSSLDEFVRPEELDSLCTDRSAFGFRVAGDNYYIYFRHLAPIYGRDQWMMGSFNSPYPTVREFGLPSDAGGFTWPNDHTAESIRDRIWWENFWKVVSRFLASFYLWALPAFLFGLLALLRTKLKLGVLHWLALVLFASLWLLVYVRFRNYAEPFFLVPPAVLLTTIVGTTVHLRTMRGIPLLIIGTFVAVLHGAMIEGWSFHMIEWWPEAAASMLLMIFWLFMATLPHRQRQARA
ncbi:MAG: hypothetical protein KDB68_05265 [Planctomycetes bacterium]|nr:hypothetical protein [Planctomycetota bacterium]